MKFQARAKMLCISRSQSAWSAKTFRSSVPLCGSKQGLISDLSGILPGSCTKSMEFSSSPYPLFGSRLRRFVAERMQEAGRKRVTTPSIKIDNSSGNLESESDQVSGTGGTGHPSLERHARRIVRTTPGPRNAGSWPRHLPRSPSRSMPSRRDRAPRQGRHRVRTSGRSRIEAEGLPRCC